MCSGMVPLNKRVCQCYSKWPNLFIIKDVFIGAKIRNNKVIHVYGINLEKLEIIKIFPASDTVCYLRDFNWFKSVQNILMHMEMHGVWQENSSTVATSSKSHSQ